MFKNNSFENLNSYIPSFENSKSFWKSIGSKPDKELLNKYNDDYISHFQLAHDSALLYHVDWNETHLNYISSYKTGLGPQDARKTPMVTFISIYFSDSFRGYSLVIGPIEEHDGNFKLMMHHVKLYYLPTKLLFNTSELLNN